LFVRPGVGEPSSLIEVVLAQARCPGPRSASLRGTRSTGGEYCHGGGSWWTRDSVVTVARPICDGRLSTATGEELYCPAVLKR
jgi:hypothetical protein